jgi:CrcB protein
MTREGPLWLVLLAVGVGAMLGAWLRWWLGYWLNARFEILPAGTLVANLGGAFVIGAVIAWFTLHPSIGPFWRLLLVTGFLGGLTTFSTFSAESLAMLEAGAWGRALLHSAAHVLGSLAAAALGVAAVRWLA